MGRFLRPRRRRRRRRRRSLVLPPRLQSPEDSRGLLQCSINAYLRASKNSQCF
nr:hypothetical protein Iba_chr12dCG0020 [Ipomoea batatas]GMD69835.1 hypothetical protein Iba_chr12eCG0470 [Ipomoea batatas]